MNRLAAMDAFVRVVDTGSFTGAARQLRIGQPAVSKMIAQLEERIGVRLLLRTTQGLTATEAGENFYGHARRAIEEADEAEQKARGASAALTGRLRRLRPGWRWDIRSMRFRMTLRRPRRPALNRRLIMSS